MATKRITALSVLFLYHHDLKYSLIAHVKQVKFLISDTENYVMVNAACIVIKSNSVITR